jgi:ABC-type multidrug transport system fused ATPase/permease subunit
MPSEAPAVAHRRSFFALAAALGGCTDCIEIIKQLKDVHERTVLIIAHRLSTVRRSNRIITIDRGRLVEDETHDELINKGGRYAALYRVQAGIQEVS